MPIALPYAFQDELSLEINFGTLFKAISPTFFITDQSKRVEILEDFLGTEKNFELTIKSDWFKNSQKLIGSNLTGFVNLHTYSLSRQFSLNFHLWLISALCMLNFTTWDFNSTFNDIFEKIEFQFLFILNKNIFGFFKILWFFLWKFLDILEILRSFRNTHLWPPLS